MFDAFGRPQPLGREQWRKDVLPKLVESYAHAPDRLAAMILQYLRDGLASDLLPAALRLAALDPDHERGLSILAAVQREVGELDGCEATLKELQQKLPASVSPLVGLAMVRDKAGNRAAAVALLWEALQKDGNHPDALHGWLQFEHQRRGQDGYAEALDEVCSLPNTWRPQLWRARQALSVKDVDKALSEYRAVIARAGNESDAMFMMVNDLGRAGQMDAIRELVLPRYRIEQHHPGIGVALLSYYVQTKQPEPGMELLHQLRVRFQRALDSQLGPFDAEFTRMTLPAAEPIQGTPKVMIYRMDRPLWYPVLAKPEFLLPPARSDKQVLFAGLAVLGDALKTAQVAREDELGRLSRSVPLFLAEQLWLLAGIPSSTALPVVEGGGWVVSGVPWVEDKLAELLTDSERKSTRIVTGAVRPDGTHRRIDLWVYDTATKQRIGHATATGEDGKLGPVYLQLLAELSPLVSGPRDLAPQVGDANFWDRYATAQAQLAALVIAAQGAMKKDRVYGHRAILEWILALALDERRSVQARMLLSAALAADAAIGSKVHRELAAPFAELFRVEPANSPFARTALPVLRSLGLEALWQQRRDEILAGGGDVLRSWVARLEGAASGPSSGPAR
ncbi:MAG: hypothetical protein ABL997_12895 [Planctomycetota bacterium]